MTLTRGEGRAGGADRNGLQIQAGMSCSGSRQRQWVRVHGVPKAATPAIGARDVSREVSVAS